MVKVYSADYRNIILSKKKMDFHATFHVKYMFFFQAAVLLVYIVFTEFKVSSYSAKHFQSSMCVSFYHKFCLLMKSIEMFITKIVLYCGNYRND